MEELKFFFNVSFFDYFDPGKKNLVEVLSDFCEPKRQNASDSKNLLFFPSIEFSSSQTECCAFLLLCGTVLNKHWFCDRC
jgi:hypothetical protein